MEIIIHLRLIFMQSEWLYLNYYWEKIQFSSLLQHGYNFVFFSVYNNKAEIINNMKNN